MLTAGLLAAVLVASANAAGARRTPIYAATVRIASAARPERVMCFGYDLPPTGIRVFDASGRRLYTVLDGSRISRVKAQGPYGYVRLANPHGGDGDAVVFELATGRVLRTVPFSNSITFVIGRNPGWFHAL